MSSSGAGEGSGLDAARIELPELPDDDPLDRLLGDRDLLLQLQLANFVGPMWDRVGEEFARYGMSVWRGWMYTGQAYIEASRSAPGSVTSPEVPLTADDIESIINDVITLALIAFRDKVLRAGKWDPQRGASLKTFFIGQCKFQFRDVYRKFERERARHRALHLEDIGKEATSLPFPSADSRLIEEETRQDFLQSLSTELARRILELKDSGYNHSEIASMLDLEDHRAVTNALHYQRRRLHHP